MVATSNGVVVANGKKLPSNLVDEDSVKLILYCLLMNECSLLFIVARLTVDS